MTDQAPEARHRRRHLSTPELAQRLGVDCSPSELAEIDEVALGRLVDHIRGLPQFFHYSRYAWDNPKYWYPEGSPAERSQYLTIGNAINFRFWRLDDGRLVPATGVVEGERLTGSMYLWRCLRRCLEEGRYPFFEASFLAALDEKQFDGLFADDSGANPLAVAREERIANLRDLGNKLERHWDGQFYNVIEAASRSLVKFVQLSAGFRAFDDPLFKLTMVNAILHLGSGIVVFDADPLPGIDYHLLKQLLRHGVLVPAEKVASKLTGKKILSTIEGHELRRLALVAFVEISSRTGISGGILDNKWWSNREQCRTEAPTCLDSALASRCPFLESCGQLTEFGLPLEESRYY